MADYTSPKPIDPIWYQPHGVLRINCKCGRNLRLSLREFAQFHRLPRDLKLYRLIKRLKCQECGARPWADVVRGP